MKIKFSKRYPLWDSATVSSAAKLKLYNKAGIYLIENKKGKGFIYWKCRRSTRFKLQAPPKFRQNINEAFSGVQR